MFPHMGINVIDMDKNLIAADKWPPCTPARHENHFSQSPEACLGLISPAYLCNNTNMTALRATWTIVCFELKTDPTIADVTIAISTKTHINRTYRL